MATKKKTISADSSNPTQTLINLWPYMWPEGRWDLKMRVVWATIFLVVAKLVLIAVPYFFKWGDGCAEWQARHGRTGPGLPARRGGPCYRL